MNIDLRNLDSDTADQIEIIKKDNHLATNKAAALKAIKEFNYMKEKIRRLINANNDLMDELSSLREDKENIKEVFKSFLT